MNKEKLREQGQNIENILRAMGISCYLRHFEENKIVQKFHYDMRDLRFFKKLKSAVDVLNACLHKKVQIAQSQTNHFAVEIAQDVGVLVYDNYENIEDEDKYTAVIGLDNSALPVKFNIKEAIHTLVGGATGMGKTTLVNNLIYALAKKNTKDTLQLAIIDTKKTLSMWDSLPLLIEKPATDGYKASDLLSKIISIMQKRHTALAKKKIKEATDDMFPRILVVVDELADLMLASNRKYVEEDLMRIAQLGRSVNINLFLATQNPIVKVCTSLIKANCPTRIALKTISTRDSMNILDDKRAKDLNGKGYAVMMQNAEYRNFKCLYVGDDEISNYLKGEEKW